MSAVRELRRTLDPVATALDLGLSPDPWQREALASSADQALWLCSRQVGKTEAAIVLALHGILYGRPGFTAAIISPSQRQSTDAMTRLRRAYDVLRRPVPTVGDSATALHLATGSRALALPASESTVRGLSVDLLILDEAAKIPGPVYTAMRPSLTATDGRLVALSTPFGRRGWFADAWHDETADWYRVKVTVQDVPRIAVRRKKWLERERIALGERAFRSEYLCEFTDTTSQFFPSDLIRNAIRDDIQPIDISAAIEKSRRRQAS